MMMAVRHGHPALAALETQSPEMFAANMARAQKALEPLEVRLGETEWISGDRLTIADGILFTSLEFARMVKFNIPDDCANLLRWQGAMRARDSATAGT
jgi:glutathione S-transferase